jgi:hypothetical protein
MRLTLMPISRAAGGGTHGDTDPRIAKEGPQAEQYGRHQPNGIQLRRVQAGRADLDDLRWQAGIERHGVCAPDQHHHRAQDHGQANGHHHRGKHRLTKHRTDQQDLDQKANQHRGRDSCCQHEPEAKLEGAGQGEGDVGHQHHQLALGEVHHAGGAVNHRKAHADEAVEQAHGDAGHDQLQKIVHQPAPAP